MRNYLAMFLLVVMNWCGSMLAQPQCTVTHYDEFSGMAQWYVTQVVQDKQGMMWFATWNGLNRFDGYSFECFKSKPGDGIDMPSDRIQDMMLMDDGNLLCLVENRFFHFNVSTCQFESLSPDKESSCRKMMASRYTKDVQFDFSASLIKYRDSYGTNWLIGYDGSISYEDSVSHQQILYKAPVGQMSDVRFATVDRNGNLWLKSHYGVHRLSFHRKPYQLLSQAKPSLMRYAFLDSKRRYWLSSKDDATICLFNEYNDFLGYLGRDGHLHQNYVSFGSPIYVIMQDSKGVVWFGSKPDGLFRLTEQSNGCFEIERFVHEEGDVYSLSHNTIFDIKEDKLGRLWIASFDGGLNCVQKPHEQKLRFLNSLNRLPCPKTSFLRARQVHITDDQKLLAATTSGLLVADISQEDIRTIQFVQHVKEISRSNSLSNNATMFVTEDNNHRLFICTESGGINQIISKDLLNERLEFRHFNRATGFPSDVALSAIPIGNELLIVSNNQLILLNPDKTIGDNYEAYLWKEHLRFSDATPIKLPDGRYLFGLQNGAFSLRMEQLKKSSFIPPIAITGISVNNSPIDVAVNAKDTLILLPPQRNMFIQFAALDYSVDADIEYAFRLGTDGTPWNYIGKDHSATFLDIKPGTYHLQIRSTNGDGVWVDNVRTLTLIVKPTFWETGWAELLYVILLLAVIWTILYTRRYIKRLKKRQSELHESYLSLLNANNNRPKTVVSVVPSSDSKMSPDDEMFMQRIMKFITDHIGDADVNIGDMAEATATSRSGLNRKMKSLLGVTPLDFIREARIRKACQLLKEGSSVNDVAYSCGFSDPKYFGRCFKAEMGMTPTEYKVENSAG